MNTYICTWRTLHVQHSRQSDAFYWCSPMQSKILWLHIPPSLYRITGALFDHAPTCIALHYSFFWCPWNIGRAGTCHMPYFCPCGNIYSAERPRPVTARNPCLLSSMHMCLISLFNSGIFPRIAGQCGRAGVTPGSPELGRSLCARGCHVWRQHIGSCNRRHGERRTRTRAVTPPCSLWAAPQINAV